MTKEHYQRGEEKFNQALGAGLARKRVALGIRQKQLAHALGVSRSQISNMEAGRSGLTAWQVQKASEFFNLRRWTKAQNSRIVNSAR